jgi:BarA-like signal transduction histidine kinase
MRVIILAATSQQGALADKLIQDKDLSKIILTVSSQKLIKEAQALIIYFESKRDLV